MKNVLKKTPAPVTQCGSYITAAEHERDAGVA